MYDCEVRGDYGVWVNGGCHAELHGVTIHGCRWCGVEAHGKATVCTLRGCTLRENAMDCVEDDGGKIVPIHSGDRMFQKNYPC